MLKNKVIATIFGEVILLAIIFGFIFIVNLIPGKLSIENLNQTQTTFLKLAETKGYTSEFRANYNNLNRIDVMFKNPNLESRDELKLTLTDENNNLIASQEYTGFNLGDTSMARMDFSPIIESKGKNYKINIIPTKLIDKKLEFGVKDNKSYFVQFYDSKVSFVGAWDKTISIFNQIIKQQAIVLILPMIFWGWFLW